MSTTFQEVPINQGSRKSPQMRLAEHQLGVPLEEALPHLYKSMNQEQIAALLGVHVNTIANWMRRLGMTSPRRPAPTTEEPHVVQADDGRSSAG